MLLAERRSDPHLGGRWEFPGGKIAARETPEAALERELQEEIGVEPLTLERFTQLDHEYPDRLVSIQFFLISEWRGEPAGLEGQRLRWVHPSELDACQLLSADLPVVKMLEAGC